MNREKKLGKIIIKKEQKAGFIDELGIDVNNITEEQAQVLARGLARMRATEDWMKTELKKKTS